MKLAKCTLYHVRMDKIKQEYIREICFDISKEIILPKYKKLKDHDIKYKNGTDLVTSVDTAEKELEKQLLKIIPNSNFVGEEAYSENKIYLIYIMIITIVGLLIQLMALLILSKEKINLQ